MSKNWKWIAYITVPSETDAEGRPAALQLPVSSDCSVASFATEFLQLAVDALWQLKRVKVDPDVEKTTVDQWSLVEVPRTVAPEHLYDYDGTEYDVRQFEMVPVTLKAGV